MPWSEYTIGTEENATEVRDYNGNVKVYIPENITGPLDIIAYHPGSGSGQSAHRDYDEIDAYIQTHPGQIVIRSNGSSGDEILIGNILNDLTAEGIEIGPIHSIGHSQGQVGAVNTAAKAIDLGYKVADVVSLDSKEAAGKLWSKGAEAKKMAENGTKLIMFDQRSGSRANIAKFPEAGVSTMFIQLENEEQTFDENHAIINTETLKNGIIPLILGEEGATLPEIPGFKYQYMTYDSDSQEWNEDGTNADAVSFISGKPKEVETSASYYLSKEELAAALAALNINSKTTAENNHDILTKTQTFLDASNQLLDGDGWNAIKSTLRTYEERMAFAQQLNQMIADENDKYIKALDDFLGTDDSLNTADLPIFIEEKENIENEIMFLEQENEQLALVPEAILKCVGEDKDGNPIYDWEHNPAYDAAQAQIRENNARINNILVPALNEFTRLINKINEFTNEVLPSLNRHLDYVEQRVNKYLNDVGAWQEESPNIKITLDNSDTKERHIDKLNLGGGTATTTNLPFTGNGELGKNAGSVPGEPPMVIEIPPKEQKNDESPRSLR